MRQRHVRWVAGVVSMALLLWMGIPGAGWSFIATLLSRDTAQAVGLTLYSESLFGGTEGSGGGLSGAGHSGAAGQSGSKTSLPQAMYIAWESWVTDAEDERLPQRQRLLLGSDPIEYDEEMQSYYIIPQHIPVEGKRDHFYNRYLLDRSAGAWKWAYQPEGKAYGFLQQGDRWYLGASYDPAILHDHSIWVVYQEEIVLYSVYLHDAEGMLLSDLYWVLAGGRIDSLQSDPNALAVLPQLPRHELEAWIARDTTRDDYPQAIAAPIRLMPRYRLIEEEIRSHKVVFYLDEARAHCFAVQQVRDGEAVDWSVLPDPAPEHAEFVAWQIYDPETQSCRLFDRSSPVTAAVTLVALTVPWPTVTTLDAAGNPLQVLPVKPGAPAPLERLSAPGREGLDFSHWVDTQTGERLWPDTRVMSSIQVVPAYQAVVSFWNHGQLHAIRAVAEGQEVEDFPWTPDDGGGYHFLGWQPDLLGETIARHTDVYARYALEICFEYGLYGENMHTVEIPQGGQVAAPDAAVEGYRYVWSEPVENVSFEQPALIWAIYEPERYTVRFVYTGRDGALFVHNEQIIRYGMSPEEPSEPYLDGYQFLGWQWPEDGSGTYVTGDVDIYALFEALDDEDPDDEPPDDELVPADPIVIEAEDELPPVLDDYPELPIDELPVDEWTDIWEDPPLEELITEYGALANDFMPGYEGWAFMAPGSSSRRTTIQVAPEDVPRSGAFGFMGGEGKE